MSIKQRILLMEDEEHLLEAIKLNLELEGYFVRAVTDGKKVHGAVNITATSVDTPTPSLAMVL